MAGMLVSGMSTTGVSANLISNPSAEKPPTLGGDIPDWNERLPGGDWRKGTPNDTPKPHSGEGYFRPDADGDNITQLDEQIAPSPSLISAIDQGRAEFEFSGYFQTDVINTLATTANYGLNFENSQGRILGGPARFGEQSVGQ